MLNRDHIKEQEEMANSIHLGKFGCMRRDYLKEHRPQLYREYLESGQLVRHLLDTDEEAYERKVSLGLLVGGDNVKPMFFTELVRKLSDFIHSRFPVIEFHVVNVIDGTENYVIMNVVFIDVCCDDETIFSIQKVIA